MRRNDLSLGLARLKEGSRAKRPATLRVLTRLPKVPEKREGNFSNLLASIKDTPPVECGRVRYLLILPRRSRGNDISPAGCKSLPLSLRMLCRQRFNQLFTRAFDACEGVGMVGGGASIKSMDHSSSTEVFGKVRRCSYTCRLEMLEYLIENE